MNRDRSSFLNDSTAQKAERFSFLFIWMIHLFGAIQMPKKMSDSSNRPSNPQDQLVACLCEIRTHQRGLPWLAAAVFSHPIFRPREESLLLAWQGINFFENANRLNWQFGPLKVKEKSSFNRTLLCLRSCPDAPYTQTQSLWRLAERQRWRRSAPACPDTWSVGRSDTKEERRKEEKENRSKKMAYFIHKKLDHIFWA